MRSIGFLAVLSIMAVSLGCAQGKVGDPVVPQISLPRLTDEKAAPSGSSRHIWGMWRVDVDPTIPSVHVIPLRSADIHLNIVHWLEVAPCNDCLAISSLQIIPPDKLSLDLTLKHPFEQNLNLTGFDVRAIFISPGNYSFPAHGRLVSLGSQVALLLNPDGYTSLFNPTEFPPDAPVSFLLKYVHGKYAIGAGLTATLNPYVAFASDQPRRMFLPGSEETRNITIQLPEGPFSFGYAVDSSWAKPAGPVIDPEKDFPPEANSLEAYHLSSHIDDLFNTTGSTSTITVEVFDHQGKDTINGVFIECPELYDGESPLSFSTQLAPDVFSYIGEITNAKGVPAGDYPVLIRVEDTGSDPNLGLIQAWLVSSVEVVPTPTLPPVAVANADPNPQYINADVNFNGTGSYDPDGGSIIEYGWDFNNDSIIDAQGPQVSHSWDTPGDYLVQLRVKDDEDQTDNLDAPIQVTIKLHEPVAVAEADPNPTYVNIDVEFDGSDSYDTGGGSIVKYEWDWDIDGIYDEEGAAANHTWTSPGTYPVQLRVTNDQSATDVLDNPLEIKINPLKPPVAAAEFYPNPGFVDQPIHFYDKYSYDPDGGLIQPYEWDWDNDGIFDTTGKDVYHSWSTPGTYEVQFRVTDDEGVTDILNQPLQVVIFQSNPLNIQDVTPPGLNFSPQDIAADGNYIYVAASGNGLHIFDISSPTNPVWVNRVYTDNGTVFDNMHSYGAVGVAVADSYAYVADYQTGLNIVDVDPPESAVIVKNVALPSVTWSVTLDSGYAFLMCEAYPSNQLVIMDIDPPEDAYIVKIIETPGALNVAIDGGYAYTDGDILRIDIDPIADAHIDFEFPFYGDGIEVANGYAYSTHNYSNPEDYSWDTLVIYDIDPPESAYLVDEIGGTRGDYMELSGSNLFISGYWHFDVYDISSPETPQKIESYGNGWHGLAGFAFNGDYAYLASRVEGIEVLNVQTPSNIILETTVYTPGGAEDLALENGYAFISNNLTGLQIYDVDPPASAAFLNAVKKSAYTHGIACDDGYAFLSVSTGALGYIQAYDIDPPASTFEIKTIDVASNGSPFAVAGGYAYVGAWGLKVIDVDPIGSAQVINTIDLSAYGVALDSAYAYVAAGNDGLVILDISVPGSESVVNTVPTSGSARLVVAENGYAYVGHGKVVDVIDIDPIESAYLVKTVDLPDNFADLAVGNGYVFIAGNELGMLVIDATTPESAYLLTQYLTPWPVGSIEIAGNMAYLTGYRNGDNGLLIYQLW